ncbi:nucleotidyltransferase domain-containing protein [Alkalicoccobacillus porphyridii]|uniref:Nucleotidyltransferase domain-containing protein n=1 Tax=Alkalicoccobacillus porphyridii TaxID=2597270 RepID=A0A553ZWX1_9BACI|nr:nucleotidyltransferase domain-containing protein [Alkalicoccobacillus porphyridii]TSB45942.1 nucleotidyltransferase domain-containing protein [Alkalicoccobacillus porphyridii]
MRLKRGYGLNAEGFIISDVSIDKINSTFKPCIQASVESLKMNFTHQLHSVYVYGSVPRGEAVPVQSDLDLIALFHSDLTPEELAELKNLSIELSQIYQSLVREVGIAIAYYDYTMDPANYYENAFLKEISICVYGEDLGQHFGPYKLTSEIAISFNGDICEALLRARKRLETATSVEEFHTFTKNFARKLIRTYYSMVMVRSQIWTTRLNEQAEVFTHYFPSKEQVIQTLIEWLINPPTNRELVMSLFKTEGEWACNHFIHEANIQN